MSSRLVGEKEEGDDDGVKNVLGVVTIGID